MYFSRAVRTTRQLGRGLLAARKHSNGPMGLRAGAQGPGAAGEAHAEGSVVNTMFNKHSTTVTYLWPGREEPQTVAFSNVFLRDASRSPTSVDGVTSQKLFTTGAVLANEQATVPHSVAVTADSKAIEIGWGDGDVYAYPLEFIHQYSGTEPLQRTPRQPPVLWDKQLLKTNITDLLSIDYESFMAPDCDGKLYQTLVNLQKYGISFITNIPDETTSELDSWYVKMIAERIGHIRHTFYGELFDVINKASAENIAYTNVPLPLHMDLLYLETVPGWQLLHAIRNSTGDTDMGMNYFADAFHAARYVRETDSDAYDALTHMPINYGYNRDDKRYHQSRPVIEEHEFGEGTSLSSQFNRLIKCVNYSPPFQKPFTYGIWEKPKGAEVSTPQGKLTERFVFKDFQRGLGLFEKYINNPENQFRVKLPEGTCVIFNNRRILHARTGFNGERWLKGCYLDSDSVLSKLQFLEEEYGG
ncbi:AaceriADR024Wp [[Ashbya] aceris (nom. inval.)]|nr:AaceriADR024Wp [[Ashbya] aceris (nom. inval.)]